VLFCTSAQGGCLGQQDARTPLLIFLIAGVVNVFGDIFAVTSAGLNMGLAAGLRAVPPLYPYIPFSLLCSAQLCSALLNLSAVVHCTPVATLK